MYKHIFDDSEDLAAASGGGKEPSWGLAGLALALSGVLSLVSAIKKPKPSSKVKQLENNKLETLPVETLNQE